MFDSNPVTVTGLVALVAVTGLPEDGVAVTEKDVAGGESPGSVTVTVAAPFPNPRAVPTLTAEIDGFFGSRKSFCCDDLPPASFLAILFSYIPIKTSSLRRLPSY